MDDELQHIKSRSFASVVSLLAQGSYAAVLGFIAFFILTVKSGAHLLGIYNTVLATLSSFNYLTNLGLGAAIMQKKDVKQVDLNTAFYIQSTLTILAVILGFYLTPHIFSFYKDLPQSAVTLYWAVLISFLFLSLKSIPSVLLEKNIEIYKVVIVQAVENTVFYLSIIIMVLLGYEMMSLVVGVLARAIVGLILIFIFNPWMPTLSFSWDSAKRLLKYGIPFQGNSFLALIKDDLLIIYLGGAIGLTNLGIVTFGKKYAEFSIRLIMDNINRVAFPLFARFQKNKKLLKKSLEKVFFYESFFIFSAVIGAIFIFDSLLKIIPGAYYDKWHLALFSFYFFSLSALCVSLYSPLINFFNAIGKVKTSLYFMIYFTILTWLLIPLSIKIFDANGISIAFFIMSLSFVLVIFQAKKYLSFSIWSFIRPNIVAAATMAGFLFVTRLVTINILNIPVLHIALSVLGGGFLYIYIVYLLKGKTLYEETINLIKLRRL